MGHNSKKKKKRGSGSGGRKSGSKDHASFSAEDSELIADELTALRAIFQEDCEVVSGPPPHISVKLRPYSKDTGYENLDISAFLSIRFLPGYPRKCPKLKIIPEKGLSEVDAEKLLSLLHDQATMETIGHFFHIDSFDISLNHGDLLEAIWTWAGVGPIHRQKVAELLSLLTSLHPQSPERKSKWVVVRRQLRQELNLPEAAVNRLQTVGLRFCGPIDQTLPRLRGALPMDKSTRRALDELSELFNYLRIWRIDRHVFLDALMPPTESYHRNIFFQVYLRKVPGSPSEGTLLAIGGRYDVLLHSMGDSQYKSNLPGAVGTSLALETIVLQHISLDGKIHRIDASPDILVCSRGGGGLLEERMELVAELWEQNIKAEFVPICDPSLTEQYEYANEHSIKCLVIITGVSPTDSVKVRHIELKKEKEVEREDLVKFLSDAMTTQFRNPALWN